MITKANPPSGLDGLGRFLRSCLGPLIYFRLKRFKLFGFPTFRLCVPDEGYSRNVPDEGYSRNVPGEGYSRNASCA